MAVPQLQLANLGEIFAQNQARQASMDNLMMQQQAMLQERQAAQAAAEREAKIREAIASGIDPMTREGASQLLQLSGDVGTYGKLIQQQAQAKSSEQRGAAAEERVKIEQRKADIYERKAYADMRNQAAQLGISAQNAETARLNAVREYGKDRTELLGQIAFNMMQQPKEQRPALYQAFRQQSIQSGQFAPEDLPEQYDEATVAGTALWAKPSKGTTVNINQGGGSYVKEIGKGFAQQDLMVIEAAKKSPDQIKTAQSVIDIVNQGKAITGTGADLRASIAKGFATVGLTSGESVAATEQLSSTLAKQTLDSIKSSGLGSGQGFTNTDREFLEKAASGKINFTPEGLLRIAELNKKAASSAYNKGQEAINRINKNPEGAAILGGYQLPPLEQQPTPAPTQGAQPQAGGLLKPSGQSAEGKPTFTYGY